MTLAAKKFFGFTCVTSHHAEQFSPRALRTADGHACCRTPIVFSETPETRRALDKIFPTIQVPPLRRLGWRRFQLPLSPSWRCQDTTSLLIQTASSHNIFHPT